MAKYIRKTRDEWQVRVFHNGEWVVLDKANTLFDARKKLYSAIGTKNPELFRLSKIRVKNV